MSDWKGAAVLVYVYKEWSDEVVTEVLLLDTDTMNNLFEKYSPLEYTFEIAPAELVEDADD